jgi:hypothetical protein
MLKIFFMKRKITPVTALVNGDFKTINAVLLTNFFGYDFTETSQGIVEYALGFDDGETFTSIQNISITIPKEVLANWGGTDDIIMDYIVKEKKY